MKRAAETKSDDSDLTTSDPPLARQGEFPGPPAYRFRVPHIAHTFEMRKVCTIGSGCEQCSILFLRKVMVDETETHERSDAM